MMWFLARSALCIGAVAAAASGSAPERLAAAVGGTLRETAEGAGRACLASRGCLRVGTEALAASGLAPTPAQAAAGPRAAPHPTAGPPRRAAPGAP